MDVSLSELREMVMNREAWRAAIHEVAKSRTRLSDWTELNWTEYKEYKQLLYTSHPLFPIVFLFNFYWSIGGFAMLLLSGIEQSQRRQWQATPVLLPGKSHGRKSLVGCSLSVVKSGTWLRDFTFTFHFHALRRKWQPTPVFLPGESQGQGSLVGCHLWGHTESDTTEGA